MKVEALFHRAESPFAHPLDARRLHVRLRTKRGDVKRCEAHYADRYDPPEMSEIVPMVRTGSDAWFDYWEGVIPAPHRRVRYAFYLEDENGDSLWYGESGFSSDRREAGVFQYPYIHEEHLHSAPDWFLDSVVYQIFPERFMNGDPTNDPEHTEEWSVSARPRPDSFYGGDLQGVIRQLPYLKELGINALYLTPIFASPSNHKYDTTDYTRIDPHFGDRETLKELVSRAHQSGIRVILDAVFNHCGYGFFAFQDVIKKGRASRYWDWFHIKSGPVMTTPKPNYETFAQNVWTMPKLRTDHHEVREYLLDVAAEWTRETGIDGWRLDVANEVDHAFWRAFRERIRLINPSAVIIGEVWHDAGPWLKGDQFDSVMNYPFREAVLDFAARGRISGRELDARLTRIRMTVPEPAHRALLNLLGSHDTERVRTACGGDDRRLRLAVLLLMTYTGVPMIYYGDEVGMEGGNDPDCRRPMIWDADEQDRDLLAYYRLLIAIRRGSAAMRRGETRTWWVDPDGGGYAFFRRWQEETVGVVLHNGDTSRTFTLDARPFDHAEELVDAMTGEVFAVRNGTVTVALGPFQGRVLRLK
ncbi:glycoside hydrolase family 13 protein [Polycladomyces sp. WAk]|uniref:Glycoside hydrolase family 13 protein n=1 Tax=Polycladomyces zharkentensis TaxID=2807616 RepID=A0ABS2WGA6_9BACL|nr:glycoside hydrolase family 13 protein [Polycladomyces sp. WAk]MBN2908459.1 glycoside hydrolase family 13 protein [Polycladomyces sp. WAk]